MPTARELLEQADALMRRNRKRGRDKGEGPPTLTDVLADRNAALAPTIILPDAARSDVDPIRMANAGTADPIALDTLSDLPVLTDVVDVWPSSADVQLPGVTEPAASPTGLDDALEADALGSTAFALEDAEAIARGDIPGVAPEGADAGTVKTDAAAAEVADVAGTEVAEADAARAKVAGVELAHDDRAGVEFGDNDRAGARVAHADRADVADDDRAAVNSPREETPDSVVADVPAGTLLVADTPNPTSAVVTEAASPVFADSGATSPVVADTGAKSRIVADEDHMHAGVAAANVELQAERIAPPLDDEFILDIPPTGAGDALQPMRESEAAPYIGPERSPPILPGSPDWNAMAEEIRMQVLQRLDLFTDTGMRDQLGARLQPIVNRASAELVETINRELGELVRGYVAEAIEREIESWRNRADG